MNTPTYFDFSDSLNHPVRVTLGTHTSLLKPNTMPCSKTMKRPLPHKATCAHFRICSLISFAQLLLELGPIFNSIQQQLFWAEAEKRQYSPKLLQELVIMFWQEPGIYMCVCLDAEGVWSRRPEYKIWWVNILPRYRIGHFANLLLGWVLEAWGKNHSLQLNNVEMQNCYKRWWRKGLKGFRT